MENINNEPKVTWASYVALFIVVIMFSGIFANSGGILKAFDFSQLNGQFGNIPFEKGFNFKGVGGSGARDGFMMAITLTPAVILALGIVSVCEGFGGLLAANRLMSPFFKPLLGIPGICGLAFSQLQLSAGATITNYFGSGAAFFPFLAVPLGIPLLMVFIMKIFGANVMRFAIRWDLKRQAGR